MKKDKLLHFGVNLIAFSVISGYMSFLLSLFEFNRNERFWISILCATLFAGGLSLGKEYGDMNAEGNKWSWLDIYADALGVLAGFMLTVIAYAIF